MLVVNEVVSLFVIRSFINIAECTATVLRLIVYECSVGGRNEKPQAGGAGEGDCSS